MPSTHERGQRDPMMARRKRVILLQTPYQDGDFPASVIEVTESQKIREVGIRRSGDEALVRPLQASGPSQRQCRLGKG
jgi:hypothetical protein